MCINKNIIRKIVASILPISAFIFMVSDVSAQCDCLGGELFPENDYRGSYRYPTAYDEFKDSFVVFVGEFVNETKVEITRPYKTYNFSYEYEFRFEVKKAWRKNTCKFIIVRMEAGCLIGFKPGELYLVYSFMRDNKLRINYCSRTKLLAKAEADLMKFEKNGEKPTVVGDARTTEIPSCVHGDSRIPEREKQP